MDESATDSSDELELDELRRRAYGLHPDIHGDVDAMARLAELEDAHRRSHFATPVIEAPIEVAPTAPTDTSLLMTEESSPQAATAPTVQNHRWGLIALALGAAIAAAGVLSAVITAWEPPPDATLQPTGAEPDDELLALLEAEGQPLTANLRGASEMQIDVSTLRAFGTHQEVEVWSAANEFGSLCLIGVHRATEDVVARQCMPTGADPFMDLYWDVYHGNDVRQALPEGHVLRFVLRADAVDVHELVPDAIS